MIETTRCSWLRRTLMIFSVIWLGFIAWRTFEVWPKIPLDMGGNDAATSAAYQTAQLQHVATAFGLSVAAPAIAWILLTLLCRTRRSSS